VRIKDSVDGIMVAPAIPRSARAAISSSGELAYAANTDARPNPAAPIVSRRRGPTRSASPPIVTRNPASTKP
jgi:hypothetical protein